MTNISSSSWSSAVSSVAETVNPISAVTRAIVEVTSSVVELARIEAELASVRKVAAYRMQQLELRHAEMMELFAQGWAYLQLHVITVEAIRECCRAMAALSVDPTTPSEVRVFAVQQIGGLVKSLERADGKNVVALSVLAKSAGWPPGPTR